MAANGTEEAEFAAAVAIANARANVAFASSLLTYYLKQRLPNRDEISDLATAAAYVLRNWSTVFPEAPDDLWMREHFARARTYASRSVDHARVEHMLETFGHMARFLGAPQVASVLLERVGRPVTARFKPKKKPKVKWQAMKDEGNALYQRRDFAGAIALYAQALWHAPREPTLYSNRALCELQLKQYELARLDAVDALHVAPSSAKLYRIHSEALVGLHLYHDALVECEKGLALDPIDTVLLARSKHCVHVEEEMEWQTQVATAGVASAQLELGKKYAYGHRGYRRDSAKAMFWLRKVGLSPAEIDATLAFGARMAAYEALHGGDHDLSLDARTHRFCHVLLDAYRPEDRREAHWAVVAEHFRAAHARGLPGADDKWARCLRLGIGTPVDAAAAAVLGRPVAVAAPVPTDENDEDEDDDSSELMDVAETFFRSAWEALEAGDVNAAVIDLEEVVAMEDEPSVFVAYATLVLAWLRRLRPAPPVAWPQLIDAEIALLKREGDEMYAHQLYAKAIEYYSRALEWSTLLTDVLRLEVHAHGPDRAGRAPCADVALLYWKRARAAFLLGAYDDVCTDMETAVDCVDSNIDFYRLWAKAALLDHDYDGALDVCDEGLALDPHDKELLAIQDDAESYL
ncbi:hypothetical protein ACHHYP_09917 [Achlya hypogyna]|uniref:Uncharacterized protein n=1 Tax=Achlya hypogyna TaxID=1202772 RepID=A0A1V9YMA1_ACHHY|nr:hypothetical protein ACHHYP_09917 [Achlya hypogyna]